MQNKAKVFELICIENNFLWTDAKIIFTSSLDKHFALFVDVYHFERRFRRKTKEVSLLSGRTRCTYFRRRIINRRAPRRYRGRSKTHVAT